MVLGASPLLNARFRIVGCKDNTAVPTIIVETTVPTMVAGIRVSITVVPVTLVRTVGSIRLAGASMIIVGTQRY